MWKLNLLIVDNLRSLSSHWLTLSSWLSCLSPWSHLDVDSPTLEFREETSPSVVLHSLLQR